MIKYFILSDIHAQFKLLTEALNKADFDMNNRNHILIINGDILDRGKEGDKTIRYLEKLIEQKRLIGVLGNHDIFLIDILKGTYKIDKVIWNINKNGFIETLQLGFNKKIRARKVTTALLEEFRKTFRLKYQTFVDWIMKLPIYIEYDKHVLVHGFIDFDLDDWHDTDPHFAVWDRGYNKEIPDYFEKKLVFGHTPNHYINNQDNIIYEGKKIMIDGGAASGKQINVLCFTEEEI
jgi:serine/threonine protein phosphatase 1